MIKVTIGIPVYNGMEYLRSALDSILTQTLQDICVIIVDDGSTDGTGEYLDSLVDPRIRVIHQTNAGTGAARNRILASCETDYLAVMDADDIALPERIASQCAYLDDHPNVCLLGTQFSFLIEGVQLAAPPVPLTHDQIVARFMAARAGMCHSSVMARTLVLRSIGGCHVQSVGEDIDLVLRMSNRGQIANLPEHFQLYRLHSDSSVSKHYRVLRRDMAYAIICEKCRREGMPEPNQMEFNLAWSKRGMMGRLRDTCDCWSTWNYRRSLVDRAKGRPISAACHLLLAGVLQPQRVVARWVQS